MGSGLILFVIVGAWLAVLVPMAVKSHDTSSSLRSVDRFGDAMRVLSRRTPGDSREVLMPKVPEQERLYPPLTAAERRRRTLLSLVGASLLTLGLALMGSVPLLLLHLVCDALLVAFVVHLRRQAVARAAQRRTSRPARVAQAARPAAAQAVRVPEQMPARPSRVSSTLAAPAARYDDAAPPVPVPAVAATGTDDSWSPVPVPLPVYVGKPVAPSRPPRIVDLTKPGEWAAGMDAGMDGAGLDIMDDGPELEEILDRRRVAGGW